MKSLNKDVNIYIHMLIESLILFIAFIVCMCVLVVVDKEGEKSSSNNNTDKQPEIHIHNNSYTDNVSEDMVKEELAQLRNEIERKQRLDMEVLEKLDELMNK